MTGCVVVRQLSLHFGNLILSFRISDKPLQRKVLLLSRLMLTELQSREVGFLENFYKGH